MKAAEMLRHDSVRLGTDHLVGRETLPEVNSARLKELACLTAEQTDQRCDVGSLRSGGGKAQEQLLESFVGARIGTLDERRVSRVHGVKSTACPDGLIVQVFEYKGKVPWHLILSQVN